MKITWRSNNEYSEISLSNSNLITVSKDGVWHNIRITHGVTSGKWYWETYFNNFAFVDIGVGTINAVLHKYNERNSHGWGIYVNGYVYYNGNQLNYSPRINTGDLISVLLDLDNGTLSFWRNGNDLGVAFNNLLGKGIIYPMYSAMFYPAPPITVNFGITPFRYAPPVGYQPFDIIAPRISSPYAFCETDMKLF